jgi:prolycopene isomerase
VIHDLLEALKVRERCEFIRVDPIYRAVYPELSIDAAAGSEAFVDAHARAFPAERRGLRDLLQTVLALREEASLFERHGAGTPPEALRAVRDVTGRPFETIRRFRSATLADALPQFLGDPAARGVFATLWPYLGLPPGEVSFVYWASMLASYVNDGAYACRGTFQRLAEALVAGIEELGGDVRFRARVSRIDTGDGSVRGVELADGRHTRAPIVVSNADARQTFRDLLDEGVAPEVTREVVARSRPSISAFVAYLATDLELEGVPHESFHYPSFDHAAHWKSSLEGDPSWFTATVPTGLDPELAPDGQHLLVLTTLVPFGNRRGGRDWNRDKPAFLARLLRRAESAFPGLASSLRYVEAGTPETMFRYTGNAEGALYGWDLRPDQVGPARLDNRTEVGGLFLAGHWARPGGGVYGAALSGTRAARQILEEA